jgi:ABC-type antimicrobial peptide transport system permease subunit
MLFFKEFTILEFKSVAGRKFVNIWILTSILLISVLTVIFSQALQDYLRKKMDSPFVKFISFDKEKFNSYLPGNPPDIDSLNNKELLRRFKINKHFDLRTGYTSFKNKNGSGIQNSVKYRIADKDPFCDFLLNNEAPEIASNFLTDRKKATSIVRQDSSWGIIISEDLMNRLNYSVGDIEFIDLLFPTNDGEKVTMHVVPVPVVGVVKQLPDKVEVIVPKLMGIALRNVNIEEHPFLIEKSYHQTYLRLKSDPSEKGKLLKQGFTQVVNAFNDRYIIMEKFNVDSVFNSTYNLSNIKGSKRIYRFIMADSTFSDNGEKYTAYFSSLDSVRSYQNFLQTQNLYLDIDVVESKENFNKLNTTIEIILLGLIAFSMYCIFLFTTNKINNHIQKNKKNLGTLKSFGMSNNLIIQVYFTISAGLITISGLIALLFAAFLKLFLIDFLLRALHITEANENLTNIRFISVEYCLIFLLSTFIFVYLNIYKTLKGKTPGDLIYNREN